MVADFGWNCANFVHDQRDPYSRSAYKAFKVAADHYGLPRDRIVSVEITRNETSITLETAVTTIMNSNCLATVVATQTETAAKVLHEAKIKSEYKGEFLVQGALSSVKDKLRALSSVKDKLHEEATRVLDGVFGVEAFSPLTERFVMMHSMLGLKSL